MDLKLAIRNIRSKLRLYILLLLTITLSMSIVLLSLNFNNVATDLRKDQLRSETMNTQISIITKDDNDIFFEEDDIEDIDFRENISNSLYRLVVGAMDEDENYLALTGLDLEELKEIHDLDLVDESQSIGLNEGLIISQAYAEEMDLAVGDELILRTEKGDIEAPIYAIGQAKGPFTDMYNVLVPITYLHDLYGQVYTSLALTIDDLSLIDEDMAFISDQLSEDFILQQSFDMDSYNSYVGTISFALGIFSFFSILMSVIMTISMFKRILEERKNQIGIQRSLGTTKLRVGLQNLFEGLVIILISSLLTIIIYRPLMSLLLTFIDMEATNISLSMLTVIIIVIFFAILILISILISLRSILNLSTIDLIKNREIFNSKNPRREIASIVFSIILIVISFVLYRDGGSMAILAIAMILFLIGGFMLIGYIYKIISKLLYLALSWINPLKIPLLEQSRAYLESANHMKLIILLIIVFSLSLQLADIIENSVNEIYGDTDIVFSTIEEITEELLEDGDLERLVRQNKIYTDFNDRQIELTGISQTYKQIASENSQVGIEESIDALLENEKGILITSTIAKSQDLKVGDIIDLGEYGQYEIIDIINSLEQSGSVLFVNYGSLEDLDTEEESYVYYLKYKDQTDIENKIDDLAEDFDHIPINIISLEELQEENAMANDQLFNIIYLLFAFTLLIGLVSLTNNLWVSILRQTKSIAVKRSLGTSKLRFIFNQIVKAISLGAIGSAIGILMSIVVTYFIAKFMVFYIGWIEVDFNWSIYLIMMVSVIIICIISDLIASINIVKKPIIKSIKAE